MFIVCLYSWWLINRVMFTVRALICLKLTWIIIPGILQWDNRAEKHSQLRENEIAFWKWQDWGTSRLNVYQHFLLSLWPFCYQKWRHSKKKMLLLLSEVQYWVWSDIAVTVKQHCRTVVVGAELCFNHRPSKWHIGRDWKIEHAAKTAFAFSVTGLPVC